MNKEEMNLKEAISLLKEMQYNALIACKCYKTGGILYRDEKAEKKVLAIETVLNYIENSIPKEKVEEKLQELDKEEKEAQDSISNEEREEYSDSSIGYLLANIETRRKVLKELLEGK